MPLTLTRRDASRLPVEVHDVRTDVLRSLSIAGVERLPILCGRNSVALAELFSVTGSAADDATVIWNGDLTAVKGIAAGMTSGTVRIEGAAGMHVGAEMRGGQVVVEGNVGDWAGAEMRGGRLVIRGNAGHCLGGAYRGSLKGMRNGEIFVHGRCGDEAGHQLRRGTIAVQESAGRGLGFGMLAGTIAVGGPCGPLVGAGMKRGTIIALNSSLSLLPSFRESTTGTPTILRMLARHLVNQGLTVFGPLFDQPFRRYWGDFVELGRGEIFVPDAGRS